ncbi:MAG: efflux RND transporter periplasmic adaptor subunit [Candidatus Hydrogenedentes bacterium]|nr:efflux RND transporter periplasmic adaptor subunit [Candidatus Hydrogenedentota bacterium]
MVFTKLLRLLAIVLAIALLGMNLGCEKAPAEEESKPAAAAKPTIEKEARDPNRLWCNEHGVYEDECVICHPEIANKKKADAAQERDPNRLWCNEHGVYEDECVICHPEIANKKASDAKEKADDHSGHEHAPGDDHGDHEQAPAQQPAADSHGDHDHGSASGGLFCKEHNLPEAECGNCRPDALAKIPVGEGLKVRFASNESISKAGVELGTPTNSRATAQREFLGQVTFNRNQLAGITPLSDGVVIDVTKDVGQRVEAGEILATLRAPEIAEVRREFATAQAEAGLANQTLAREKDLYKREISARQDLEAAQASVAVHQSAIEEARQHLLTLGLSKEEINDVLSGNRDEPVLPLRAPIAGTIIARDATRGKAAKTDDALFEIADMSTMWFEFSVPEDQLASIVAGTKISARFDAYPGVSFDGEVQWIAAAVDPQTRVIKARAVLANPQAMLKDGLFGRATITGAASADGLSVPATAIQDVDGRPVVFRKLEDDLYETRPVEIGASDGGNVLVLAGLDASYSVVTQGSYVVKSELLKARLGAGCTDH